MPYGDDSRFAALYESQYRKVFAYCRRRTNGDIAEDTTAEVFLVAWRRIDDCPADEQMAVAWLYGIAYRKIGHVWRGSARRRRLAQKLSALGVSPQDSPDDVFLTRSDTSLIRRAASRLRPEDQEILRLALWEELPHRQIATVLGLSVDASKQRLARAKKRLTAEFNALEAGSSTPVAREGGES